MAKPFFNTTRSLKADNFNKGIFWLLLSFVIFAFWAWWFFAGEVATYEVTSRGRVEVAGRVYPLDAPMAGKVASHRLQVGREVFEGEVLLTYERGRQRIELDEEERQLGHNKDRLKALDEESLASKDAVSRSLAESQTLISKSKSQLKEAQGTTKLKEEVTRRYQTLSKDKLISELDLLNARLELEQAHNSQEKYRLELELAQSQKSAITHQLAIDEARRERDRAQLGGEIAKNETTIERLKLELRDREVRAPVTGKIGEVGPFQPGSFLDAGARICTLVPTAGLHVYADFTPAVAVGRIRPGQKARIRLDGFPWTQYGTLQAQVSHVGSEVRNDYVQVDFTLSDKVHDRIPIQHGLPGTVEVEVGRYTPAELVLRALGKFLSQTGKGNN